MTIVAFLLTHSSMESKALVTRLALLIVSFSVGNTIITARTLGSRGLMTNIIGIIINVIVAVFLVSGQNWARWVMAIRCGFGVIFFLVGWAGLGNADVSLFSVIRLWMLVGAIVSAAFAAFLLFSKTVNDHFNPSTGF